MIYSQHQPRIVEEDGDKLYNFDTGKCDWCRHKAAYWSPRPPKDTVDAIILVGEDDELMGRDGMFRAPGEQCWDQEACDRRWFKRNPEKGESSELT